MKMHPYIFAVSVTVIAAVSASALSQTKVYRAVDKDGNVTYSDKATPGSTVVEVAPVQTVSSQPSTSKALGGNAQSGVPAVPAVYNEFSLVSPEHDKSIRSNSGAVTIGVRIDPELRDGDRIRVLIDAKPFGEPSRLTVHTLTNIDRGTHRIEAQVIDGDGKVLASAGPVTFHLLRTVAKRAN